MNFKTLDLKLNAIMLFNSQTRDKQTQATLLGNRMLDMCPQWKSCGTSNPMWTDGVAPEEVGVATVATAYKVSESSCKQVEYVISIMRCSKRANDLIYKQVIQHRSICYDAFCGMR